MWATIGIFLAAMATVAPAVEGARAFFVFRDSLVDNGNNNYLATTARADSPPYGIDYLARRPTGCFSNGYNIPDLISFITSKVACCGQGPYNGVGICTPLSNLCPNRDVYTFWDPFHPTERADKIIVQTILTGSDMYMSPMNLSTITALDSIA